jgi:dipeptidase E
MKLAFFSGGTREENYDLDHTIFDHISHYDPRFTFIASCKEDADQLYHDFIEYYRFYGVRHFRLIIHEEWSAYDHVGLEDSDLVYLSGGNTFYFLDGLKQSGLFFEVQRLARENQAIVAGHSAGAIIMTPTINMADYPSFDRDDNFIELANLKSMKLVNFEFFPHYINSKNYIHAFNMKSHHLDHPLYCCPDGSGVFVARQNTTFFGKVYCYFRGKKFVINY